ncbi:MAG TPA: efflux transporter outer membrane subunit [Steroidobacteraceae bacterium]
MKRPCRRARRSRPGPLLLVAASLLAAGCVSSSSSVSHERPLDTRDLALTGPTYTVPADGWWRALDDPQLDRLVGTALARNPGLAGSIARVRSAQALAAAAGSVDSPQVTFDASEFRTRVSENYIFPPPYGGGTYWDGRLGFNLAWHLDFWGRQAALVAQVERGADAAALDAAGAELLLSGSVTQAYVEYARALLLEQVALAAQAQRRALVDLTLQRVSAGLDSQAEARTVEGNLEQAAVDIEQARLARQAAEHALAALTGASAAAAPDLATPALDFERALPLPAALPADLLARRPDVRAARMRVDAAVAGRAAAHASFYPNVDIVGFAGLTAIGLDRLLEGDSLQWSVGPAIHLPVFDAGRLKAEYRRSGADVDVAVAAYNETVLRAVREAADQVSRVRSLDLQLAAQARSLEAAESAHALALQRYSAGIANQLTVLNTETQLLAARRQRTQLLADRTGARVALLVALGGHLLQEPAR